MDVASALMPPDQRLLSLVTAAESGVTSPRITIFTAGWVHRGQLISFHWFVETTRQHRHRELEQSRDFKKADQNGKLRMQAEIDSVHGFMTPGAQPETSALNLAYVVATSPAGTSMLIPALRVPMDAVESWSLVEFPMPAASGGGGAAFGVAVPLP